MSESRNDKEDERGLIEVLVDKGSLPSFDLPVDVVSFESQYVSNWRLLSKHNMRQPLGAALTQWTPSRRIVVEKTIYEVAGLLVPFVPGDSDDEKNNRIKKNRFQHFLGVPGNLRYLLICRSCGHVLPNDDKPLNELEGPNLQLAEEGGKCPTCESEKQFLELEWIKPPGYGPEVDEVTQKPLIKDSLFGGKTTFSELSSGRVRWPVQYADQGLEEKTLRELDHNRKLKMVFSTSTQRLTQISGRQPQSPDGDDIGEYGFPICELCGLFDPSVTHRRPYPVYGLRPPKEAWSEYKNSPKCTGDPKSLLLGRPFHSAVLSLIIPLGATLQDPIVSDLTPDSMEGRKMLEMAGFTLGRVVIDIIARTMRFQPGEFDCDIRFNSDFDNPGSHVMEIFFFETTDGGSGNIIYFKKILGSLLEKEKPEDWTEKDRLIAEAITTRLNGKSCNILVPDSQGHHNYESHPCEKACNGCLLDYRGTASEHRLHRELAFHLWLYSQGEKDKLRNSSELNLSTSMIEFSMRCKSEPGYLWDVKEIRKGKKWVRLVISEDDEEATVEAISDLLTLPLNGEHDFYFHAQTLRRNPIPKMVDIEDSLGG